MSQHILSNVCLHAGRDDIYWIYKFVYGNRSCLQVSRWVCLHFPSSSSIDFTLHISRVVLSVNRYKPETCKDPVCNNDPILCPGAMVCEPRPPRTFEEVDAAVIYIFTIEYFLKFLTCWAVSPRCVLSWWLVRLTCVGLSSGLGCVCGWTQ